MIKDFQDKIDFEKILKMSLNPKMSGWKIWVMVTSDEDIIYSYSSSNSVHPYSKNIWIVNCDFNNQDIAFFSDGWTEMLADYIAKVRNEGNFRHLKKVAKKIREKKIMKHQYNEYYVNTDSSDAHYGEIMDVYEMVEYCLEVGDFSQQIEELEEKFRIEN